MPQIIVIADTTTDDRAGTVMFTERASVGDFESQHYQTQLVERLGWAVGDAAAVERQPTIADGERHPTPADPEHQPMPADAEAVERPRELVSDAQLVS